MIKRSICHHVASIRPFTQERRRAKGQTFIRYHRHHRASPLRETSPAMEAFAAAPAAGVFAGSGTTVRPAVTLRRRRSRGAGRVRLVRAPPPRAGGFGDGGDLPPLDKWDMMELEFVRFLGEDHKLTLAKVPLPLTP